MNEDDQKSDRWWNKPTFSWIELGIILASTRLVIASLEMIW